MRCPTGKVPFATYADALAKLTELDRDGLAPLLGSVYTCPYCGEFHITSRRFTIRKPRGRGKQRRGIVFKWTAA